MTGLKKQKGLGIIRRAKLLTGKQIDNVQNSHAIGLLQKLIDIKDGEKEPLSSQTMNEIMLSVEETTIAEEDYNRTVGENTYFSSTVHKICPFKSLLPSMDQQYKSMITAKQKPQNFDRGGCLELVRTTSTPQVMREVKPMRSQTNSKEKEGEVEISK